PSTYRSTLKTRCPAIILRLTRRPMYCPKCATQNAEKKQILLPTTVPLEPSPLFCRSCGANLSLVPQALTGRLPFQPKHREDLEHGEPATLANGISKLFMGVGFLLVSFACYF